MHEGERIHFVGIGGYGMGPLAKIMLDMGYKVSGSDMKPSERTDRMQNLGARVVIGHSGDNVTDGTGALVISAAIPPDNPEIQTANAKGIPVFTHAEMVGRLMSDKIGIGVSGAHGKTTTTSMVCMVLWKNGLSPTMLIGGEVDEFSGGGNLGKSDYFVVEADEAYGRFLEMMPKIAAVTNIDDDHLDYYGTFENILNAFETFLAKLPDDGLAILNIDNQYTRSLAERYDKRKVTYSIKSTADLWASDLELSQFNSTFKVHRGHEELGTVRLSVAGEHNVSNALVAVAVGLEAGLPFERISEALTCFRGVHRRFELYGVARDIMVVDDYAHHPTAIKAMLHTAREIWDRRIVAVFQPQRFTRTQLLMDEFAKAFSDADLTIIEDIYYEGTGEEPIPGVSAERLAELVKAQLQSEGKGSEVIYMHSLPDTVKYLAEECRQGDLVLTMGAGDVWKVADGLIKELTAEEAGTVPCK